MHIRDRKALDGRFQVPEALLGNDGSDLGGRSAGAVSLLYYYQPSRFRDRGEYGLFIEGNQRPWIYDLDAYPFFGQRFRGGQSLLHP